MTAEAITLLSREVGAAPVLTTRPSEGTGPLKFLHYNDDHDNHHLHYNGNHDGHHHFIHRFNSWLLCTL